MKLPVLKKIIDLVKDLKYEHQSIKVGGWWMVVGGFMGWVVVGWWLESSWGWVGVWCCGWWWVHGVVGGWRVNGWVHILIHQ